MTSSPPTTPRTSPNGRTSNERYERMDAPGPRPVGFGCFVMAAVVVIALLGGGFCIAFLESGADTGELKLEDAEAYAVGSVEFIPARNFFLVRLTGRDYYALADLDAANRANPARRCRVQPVATDDPALPGLIEEHSRAMSDEAAGSTFLLREACNGALYDVTGVRLDAAERNLDRYPVSVGDDGRLVVDVSERLCTQRAGGNDFAEVECE